MCEVFDLERQQSINLNELNEYSDKLINNVKKVLKQCWDPNTFMETHGKSRKQFKYSIKLGFTSIYRQVFKIFAIINIKLQFDILIEVQFKISTDNRHISSRFPESTSRIIQTLRQKRLASAVKHSIDEKQVRIVQMSNFVKKPEVRIISQIIFHMLMLSHTIAEILLEPLRQQIYLDKAEFRPNEKNPSSVYNQLGMIEKETTRFKHFYQVEGSGNSLFKCPGMIEKRNHQIVRTFEYTKNANIKCEKKKHNCDGFSSVIYTLEANAQIFNTIIWNRDQATPKHKLSQAQKQQEYPEHQGSPSKINLAIKIPVFSDLKNNQNSNLAVLKERVSQFSASQIKGVYASFKNEKYFIESIVGNLSSPFICNYYLERNTISTKTNNKQPAAISNEKDKIYLELHQQNAHEIFYGDRPFTMLDILNFTQQVLAALETYYIRKKSLLHRDIKAGNIMWKDGVIQIIDHGSIYPHSSAQPDCLTEEYKKHLDSKLRSTFYVKQEMFYRNSKLVELYTNYRNYLFYSKTHETFDVYSVGVMLSQILRNYECFAPCSWMEVHHRWQRLLYRMTQQDFMVRAKMKAAFEQVQNIRQFLFAQTKN